MKRPWQELVAESEARRKNLFYICSFRNEKSKLVVSCKYCTIHLTFKEFTVDHVLAQGLGGTHAIENLVPACSGCNRHKARVEGFQIEIERRRTRSGHPAAFIRDLEGKKRGAETRWERSIQTKRQMARLNEKGLFDPPKETI